MVILVHVNRLIDVGIDEYQIQLIGVTRRCNHQKHVSNVDSALSKHKKKQHNVRNHSYTLSRDIGISHIRYDVIGLVQV